MSNRTKSMKAYLLRWTIAQLQPRGHGRSRGACCIRRPETRCRPQPGAVEALSCDHPQIFDAGMILNGDHGFMLTVISDESFRMMVH